MTSHAAKIARREYKTRFMTKFFGSKYTANTVMAIIILSLSSARNLLFVCQRSIPYFDVLTPIISFFALSLLSELECQI